MKRHYWEAPIAIYLFLGGLGGGIMFLSWVLSAFVFPGADLGGALVGPMVVALIALAVGCFFLVFELGQPPVFWRVFTTATAIIKWGATLLSVAMFAGLFWALSYLPWDWIEPVGAVFAPGRGVWLGIAGVCGFGIMVYTGVMLSTLKAHAFWATPALPVLFTVSALSTACAAITLSACGWPAVPSVADEIAGVYINALLHVVDIALVATEVVVLLIMVLSFLGAGNVTAKAAARRWVVGSYAPLFWIGMIGAGLVAPFIMYVAAPGFAAEIAAPVLVLCGGLLLRFLVVYTDDRAPLPGEEEYFAFQKSDDERYLEAWKEGNLY